MKKYIFIFILLLLPGACSAQFIGLGAQYTDAKEKGNAVQFAANALYPYYHKPNRLNTFISGGIDYTGGSSPVSGLNIKPISISTFFGESFFNKNKYTILLSCDGGYLFNLRHGKDGVIITPNVYFDYKVFFIKVGYDFNITEGEKQFFVRGGISFGMGTIKMIAPTKIW